MITHKSAYESRINCLSSTAIHVPGSIDNQSLELLRKGVQTQVADDDAEEYGLLLMDNGRQTVATTCN